MANRYSVQGGSAGRLGAAAHDHPAESLAWQKARYRAHIAPKAVSTDICGALLVCVVQARHWATKPRYAANGTVLPSLRRPPHPFGSGYRRVLYTLTPEMRIRRHSREFCLPALSADGTPLLTKREGGLPPYGAPTVLCSF